ncbi:MAG: glycerol-3-phosphate 1-O-acyltransferase PlsY [Lentisphaeria bacterium]|nr:glycerol-3-phosphate 1-O-acyltransferase PlsY [Lentisphaeria bacterium]MBR4075434.1 glycerol-3-phosphate 1-O-acyltransferase PlsY [Lentisphaeria bacterium]
MNAQLETGLTVAAVALTSYLIGSTPFGLIIGKLKGKDIRKEGSGNIGATNVTRVVGKGWGKLCFVLDFLKGAIPVLLVSYVTPKELFPFLTGLVPAAWQHFMDSVPDPLKVLPSLAAFAAVAGHIWPVYLKFKGGKGVSTAAGAILALNPFALIGAAIIWVVTFLISRYVSLASILAAGSMPVFAILFTLLHITRASLPEVLLFFLLALLTIVKHSSNIRRLRQGTESRFEKKEKSE